MNNTSKKNKRIIHVPIYLQLREIIRNSIEDGEYLPGTAIPSENELADFYKINRITVRNAVDALVQEGLLKSIQGNGVFVIGEKLQHELGENEGFSKVYNDLDEPSKISHKTKELRLANNKYAEIFDIDANDKIHFIKRLIEFKNNTISIENIFIPEDVLPELSNINVNVFSIVDILSFYNVTIAGKRQSIEIVNGDEKIRKQLNVPNGVAIILMETWYQNKNGNNIVYTQQWLRSDQTSFVINL